nr:uncharacterized protein LOC109166492 [Ipomoea trifida]
MRNGVLTKEFLDGLKTFIEFATSQRTWMDGERIRCPCTQRKCQNTKFLDVPTVKYHLAKFGFVSDYYVWRFHGERILPVDVDRDVGGSSQMASEEPSNAYHTMVMDAAGVEFNVDEIEESPNPEAQKFYDMLKAADQELFPECKKHSQLSFVARLMSLKSENHISEKCFNQITELIQEVVLNNNLVPDNFYETKRLLRARMLLNFDEFVMLQKFYKWDESIEAQVRKAFLAQAGLRYADMLSKFKTKRTSTGRPACVAEETWAIWEAYWDRPDVKAKSEQQRKNRMSEVEGLGTGCSKHTGGSRSAIEHYHKWREELQKEPNLFECFAQMHKKKDGMFVDERSKRIAEQVQARHDIATQEAEDSTESPNINMSQLYVDVVGGAKKQRIYGLGTKGSSFINGNSCGSSATSQLHQDAMKDMMNQQLETMRVDMEAKLQAEMDVKLQAERNQMQAQMQTQIQTQIQAQITSLMDELRRNVDINQRTEASRNGNPTPYEEQA